MHILIVGGGIIGALSAYYLDTAGARVTLVEKNASLAAGTSDMNGAQLAYSYTAPLGSPAIYGLMRRLALGGAEDVKVANWLDPALVAWGLRLLARSGHARYGKNQRHMLALGLESRALMDAFLARHPGIDFDYARNGKLYIYGERDEFDAARKNADVLGKQGLTLEILPPEACLAREPALRARPGPLAGGILSPLDAVGDCGKFTRALKGLYSANVTCRTGLSASGIHVENGMFRALETANGERIGADALLVCAGAEAGALLGTAGLRVPVYPVKGFSAEIPNDGIGLEINVTDKPRRVVFAPLGGRVRMAGFMHFSGFDPALSPAGRAHFLGILRQTFPAATVPDDLEIRAGFRPHTPDSTPIIGATRIKGLYVNIGHGMLGWTHAHAACKKAAEAVMA